MCEKKNKGQSYIISTIRARASRSRKGTKEVVESSGVPGLAFLQGWHMVLKKPLIPLFTRSLTMANDFLVVLPSQEPFSTPTNEAIFADSQNLLKLDPQNIISLKDTHTFSSKF